jgi:hypothetical protein
MTYVYRSTPDFLSIGHEVASQNNEGLASKVALIHENPTSCKYVVTTNDGSPHTQSPQSQLRLSLDLVELDIV